MLGETDIAETLKRVVADTFDLNDTDIDFATGPQNCPEWTSLNHLTLLSALEERFDCRFSLSDMSRMTDFGSIFQLLSMKVS